MNEGNRTDQNEVNERIRHEKEHIKANFLKFVDSALQGYLMFGEYH